MKASIPSVLLIGFAFASAAAGEDNPWPGGWSMHSHYAPHLYRIGIDYEISHGGKWSGFLESADADYAQLHYASLVQSIDATKYRGKRLRLSAFLKTRDVKTRAEFKAIVPIRMPMTQTASRRNRPWREPATGSVARWS